MDDDTAGGPRTSRAVTILDAARYDGNPAAVLALAGDLADTTWPEPRVQGANGQWIEMHHGDVLVKYGDGDFGVMSAGEWDRYFG